MYGVDEDEGGGGPRLRHALRQSMSPASAMAYMVFVLLYFPCIATFVAIRQESGGWKWALFSAVYTICVGWLAAFAVYRLCLIWM